MSSANVLEVFASVQGEGKYVGCRQIFVRLADCNLACVYCDTDCRQAEVCHVETAAGFRDVKNPLEPAQVANAIKSLSEDVPTQAVSFTGGEPLLHWRFVRDVAGAVRGLGMKIFLETNGTLCEELEKVLDVVDIISMDIKLPSVTGRNLFSVHERFLRVAQGKDICVKLVVTGGTPRDEFLSAIETVAVVDASLLTILQPASPVGGVVAPSAGKILSLQAAALRRLRNVRVIPQTHKLLNLP